MPTLSVPRLRWVVTVRPEGWVSLAEAARKLGVSKNLLEQALRKRLVPAVRISFGKTYRYMTDLHAWERGLRWLREMYPHLDPEIRRKRRLERARTMGAPQPIVSPERAQERIDAMTPRQRRMYRLLIWGLLNGYGVPAKWDAEAADDLYALLRWQGGRHTLLSGGEDAA